MANLREQAMKEIAEEILKQDPISAKGFIEEVLMRVPDMDLFSMYYTYFGHPVGEQKLEVK